MTNTKPLSLSYVSLAGLALFFIAMGSCRFSYPPVMPLMITEHWSTLPQAGYLGSANFVGYFFGVVLAPILGRTMARSTMLIGILLIAIVSLFFCTWNLGFDWLFFWRLLNGIAGGSLMVLVPSLVLTNTPQRSKGLVTGIMFSGIGIGTIVLSEMVPLLDRLGGIAAIWLGFTGITLVMAIIAYPLIMRTAMPLLQKPAAKDRLTGNVKTALLWGAAAYFIYGLGITPHYLFLADYARQALHANLNISSLLFSVQGVGLAMGGLIGGLLKDWLGTYKGLLVMVVVSAISIILVLAFHDSWALGVSGFLMGMSVMQVVLLMSLHLDDLVGVERHAQYWSKVTMCYAIAQFVGGYGFSGLLALHLPYISMFWVGLGFMVVTFGLYLKMR